MSKINSILDLRRIVAQEKFDRKNTRVYVRLPTGTALPITGVELDIDGTDNNRLAVYFTVEDAAETDG